MVATKLHLPRIQHLIKEEGTTKKKAINYANYSNEDYNILTLENHSDYYKGFKNMIPSYIRDKPDWSKSLYKRKKGKIDKYNYLMYRNVRNISRKALGHGIISRNSLYQTVVKREQSNDPLIKKSGTKSVMETLPFIKNKKDTQSSPFVLSKRSLSSCSRSNKKSINSVKKENKLRRSEELLKRAEQLGKFLQSIKSEEGKELIRTYGKRLVEKLNVSDITKERMKIAIETPAEDIQRLIENALGVKLDEENEEVKKDMEDKELIKAESKE